MMDCSFERLYIAKRGKDCSRDIYVDKAPTLQYELDGIRFLYKSLKKQKRGVILNDPPNYGKRKQTALFIGAVLPILERPVLILCQNENELQWLRIFQDMTDVSGDDVAVEKINPFKKKKVLVCPIDAADAFSRREWSVLVLDGDLSKSVLKAPLRADLRIWLTSESVEQDLSKFSTFYSWIHPKDRFDIDKYKPDKSDRMDVYMKSAMLHAFMEDYVLRRELHTEPPQVSKNIHSITKANHVNKDDTGTKIKDSKRKPDDINLHSTKIAKKDIE